MKRWIAWALAVCLCLLFTPFGAEGAWAEDRIVLTIGDWDDRSANRYDGENQLGIWRYLEEQLGVEIQYVRLSEGRYEEALATGNLPDLLFLFCSFFLPSTPF